MDGDSVGGFAIPQTNIIIENYETLTSELVKELHFVKAEHDDLKTEITNVIHENKRLTQQLGELLSSKENQVPSKIELNENLRQQIKALLLEKEHAMKLWQNSMASIGILEDELRVYQAGNQELMPRKECAKMKGTYEEKIRMLEDNLQRLQMLLSEKNKTAHEQIISKSQELEKALENQNNAFKIVKNLEDEVLALQNRMQECEKMNKKQQKTIKENNEAIEKLTRKNTEYRRKVEEAVQVIDAALNEKDAAIFRQKQAEDEIAKINLELNEIVRETEEKIKNEVARAKIDISQKYNEVAIELKKCQDELRIKSLEVEKFSTKCELLEEEMNKIRKGNYDFSESNASKLLMLEKNLESTFQKLLLSEKLNIQLMSEKETIKNDMEQMAGHYERTLRAKEIEKISLQNRIKQFETQLDEERSLLNSIKCQLDSMRKEKDTIEKDLTKQNIELEKSLSQTFTTKYDELKVSYTSTINDLHIQLEAKDKMNKKWMSETKNIIENLEKLVSDLRGEVHRLKKENKKLSSELRDSRSRFEQYKSFLQIISQDVNSITETVVNAKDRPG